MIELIAIALASLAIAVVLVWAWRKLTDSQGMATSLVSLSNRNGSLRLSQQQGFVSLQASPRPPKKAKKPRQGRAKQEGRSVRKPWGW